MENMETFEQESTTPFEIKFFPERGTLLLETAQENVDLEAKKTEAQKLGLLKKKEFHLTVIGNKTGKAILKSLANLEEVKRNEILTQIPALFHSLNCQISLEPEFYHLQKDYHNPDPDNPQKIIEEKRQTIIQLGDIKGLDQFYQELNTLLNTQLETPMPHVTLYANSTQPENNLTGIGIYSRQEFEELQPKKI